MASSDIYYTPIKGVYRPGLSSIERLKKTGIGQQEIFAQLIEALEESAGKHAVDHTLFIGPSGIGKTHLMKLFTDKITRSRSLMASYRLITFPVDNHRITSLTFLLIELLKHLAETTKEDNWQKLREICDEADDLTVQQTVKEAIEQSSSEDGRFFLVLFENFDAFFNKSEKNEDVVKEFSDFLANCASITFIGTALTSVTDSNLLKCRPFTSFNIQILKELDLEQTRKLVHSHLKYDKQTLLLNTFNELSPKIQALHELTGGNPRLILLLYELLTDESTKNIKSLFEELLDRVTPYFLEKIRSLSPAERALLTTLASMRSGYNTKNRLSKSLRMTVQQCSNILNRLCIHGFLLTSDHPTDKRSKVYGIREGFFDLWLAIGQLKEPKRFLPLLGEFLGKWYSDKTSREKKRQQLWMTLQVSEAGEISNDVDNTEILLNYLANIGGNDEQSQNQLELAFLFATTGRKKQSRKILKTVNAIMPENLVYNWVAEKIEQMLKDTVTNGFNQQLIDLFDCWKYVRIQLFDQVVSQAVKVSSYFDQNSYHETNIAFLSDTISNLRSDTYRLPLFARIAGSQEKEGQLNEAIISWKKVLKITDVIKDQKSKGTTLNNLSQVYQDQGNYAVALEYLEQALEILQRINDYDGQSTTLNNIATNYFAQGYYEKALEYFQKTLTIIKFNRDLPLKAITLSNISFIYKVRGEIENAINSLEQSLSIMRKTGNKSGEAKTLFNISQIYGELGDLDRCHQYFQPAFQIMQANKENQATCHALLSLGKIFWEHENHKMALSSWRLLRQIGQENKLHEQLEQLDGYLNSLGITELNPSTALS